MSEMVRVWIARFAPIGVAGSVALLLGFGPDRAGRQHLFEAWGPDLVVLVIVAAVALMLVAFARSRRSIRDRKLIEWLPVAALALGFLLVASALPGRMRVQADEYLLAGAAFRLQMDGSPEVLGTGLVGRGGRIEPATRGLDKRGLLYPIAVGAVHRVRGYTPSNLFIVNTAFGLFGVVILYVALRTWGAASAALPAAVLLATHPLYLWTARSGGMEAANLALLLAGAVLVALAFRRPQAHWAALLLLLGPILAQARYESVLAGAVASLLGYARLVELGAGPARRILAACVLFGFLPFAWQRAIPFEHGTSLLDSGQKVFAAEYVLRNVGAAIDVLVRPRYFGWGQTILTVLSVAALALVWKRTRARPTGAHIALSLYLAAVAAGFGIVLAMVWADFRETYVARLALPAVLATIVGAGMTVGRIGGTMPRARLHVGLATLVVATGSFATALRDRQYDGLPVGPALNTSLGWMSTEYSGCRVLVVTPYSAFYIPYGYSVLMPHQMVEHANVVDRAIARGAVDAILALEVRRNDTGETVMVDSTTGLETEVVADVNATPKFRLHVERVLGPAGDPRWSGLRCSTTPAP